MTGSTSAVRIRWIGTGVMGQSMCGHLLAAGHPTTVYSRTRAKAEHLISAGATWADSPAAVAASSDVVFTMVGFPQDVRDVYFSEQGILAGAKPGTLLVARPAGEHPPETIPVADIIGRGEIRVLAGGVTHRSLQQWRAGFNLAGRGPFPEPIRELESGPLFDRRAVIAWLERH